MYKIDDGKVLAVDFDGTLVTDCFPEIGEPNLPLIEWLKDYRKTRNGKLILFTSRNKEALPKAVEYCKSLGLEFDAINENLKEVQEKWQGDTRKVLADYYIDDKALLPIWKSMN